FKDYRGNPKNEIIQYKCIVYAGALSHFTGDAAMPLHTTRDYDGKKGPDGKMVQRGIHAKIDAFPEKNKFTAEELSRDLAHKAIDAIWAYVVQTIQTSHTHVKRCYELDANGEFEKPTEQSWKFIVERCRTATQFTMDLWYNAWLRSEKLPAHY